MAAAPREEEVELIVRAQHDPEAFGALFVRHYAQIYRYAYVRLRDRAEAEDLASDVFMKAFVALPRYRPAGRPFLGWLYRIAANALVDRHRRANPAARLEASLRTAEEETPESIAVQATEVGHVWMLIHRLPREQRRALVLKFVEDRSNRDIAAGMGRSLGATKVLVHRALTRVREQAGVRPGSARPSRTVVDTAPAGS